MEENVDTILGVDTTGPQRPYTPTPQPQMGPAQAPPTMGAPQTPPPAFGYTLPYPQQDQPTLPEKVLNILAIIVLVLGGLATLGFLVAAFKSFYEMGQFLLFAVGGALYTLLAWGLLKLFVQIAKTLREINSKLK